MRQSDSDRERENRTSEEELSRLNRTLQTLYRCNHALVHATDEQELFESVCKILVEVGGRHVLLGIVIVEERQRGFGAVPLLGEDAHMNASTSTGAIRKTDIGK